MFYRNGLQMSIKISVPLESVQSAVNDALVLDHPDRCSRCGAQPAEFYETHLLRLRIGAKKPGLYRQSFRINQPYRLRIRICQTCYQADFVTGVENLEHDQTSSGRLARIYARLYTIGAIIACAGLLLMTDIIPNTSALGAIKQAWFSLVAIGGAFVLGVWLHMRHRQSQLLARLNASGVDLAHCPRTEVRTPILPDENDPAAIPLELRFQDEQWAKECADYYHWTYVTDSTTPLKGDIE